MSDDALRPCPMCGEPIRAVARKCRFCGEMLEGADQLDEARIREAARRLIREDRDKSTALQLLIVGIIPCGLSPIIALYGTLFLLFRQYDFPRKNLAIIGTVVSWIWTLALAAAVAYNVQRRGF